MSLFFRFLVFIAVVFSFNTWGDEASHVIGLNEPKTKLFLSKKYPENKNFLYYNNSAAQFLEQSNPWLALLNFQMAYRVATTIDEKKMALFGITRSALWIEHYSTAMKAFDELSMMPLSPEDRDVVATGRVIAKTNTDYPRTAFKIAQSQMSFRYPMSVIAASKAALGAGWGYKAKAIVQSNQALLAQIPPQSFLQNQRKIVDWLIVQQTSKGSAGMDFFTVQDSEQFKTQRVAAFGSYRALGVNSNSTVRLLKNKYFDPTSVADANMLLLRQDFLNIHDQLELNLTAIPTNVTYTQANQSTWNPFLWSGNGIYSLNDYFSFALNNSSGLVETTLALENEISMNTSEASVFIHPIYRVFGRFSGFHSTFTDQNTRNGLSASLNYQLISELGLFGELRYRGFQYSFYNDPNYFSPSRLQEGTVFLIMKHRFFRSRLFLSGEAGIGQQIIKQTPSGAADNKAVFAYNINLNTIVAGCAELNVNYGYTQAAFANLVGSYAQTYFGATVRFYLD